MIDIKMKREEAIEILENGGWWDLLVPITTIEGRNEEDKLHRAIDMAVSMHKQRHDPFNDSGEMVNSISDNSTQKNKKYLKYSVLFLLGLVFGMFFALFAQILLKHHHHTG